MRIGKMRTRDSFLLFLPVVLVQSCSLTSNLDKYDDYRFEDNNSSDAGEDGSKPTTDSTEETWWQRYDRLSLEASPQCAELTQEHLYCTGGVALEVDLSCPEHCHAVTGRHCFCPYKREYPDAENICQSTDMHLVTVDDRAENELIGDLLLDMNISSDEEIFGPNGVDGAVWIGLNDLDEEGIFVWPDGSKTSYQPWAYNQPDNGATSKGEDCVALQVGKDRNPLWYDYACEAHEGMEIAKRMETAHFFFCETKDADKEIGTRSVEFINGNSAPCQRPSSLTPGEACCTTLADAARFAAIEPGRCGLTSQRIEWGCSQSCRPGKVDYESGCPENLLLVGAPRYPPCCTLLGNDSAGYLCGLWESTGSGGCFPNSSATTTCPKPTAYKGPDEPLVIWKKCGDKECKLKNPQELAWAKQCCTVQNDVDLLLADEPGQCGMNYADWGSPDCVQLDGSGERDQTCPSFPLIVNLPTSELEAFVRPGCCSDFGVCGMMNPASNLGCRAQREDMKDPYRLCRRANKDENLGVDPLLEKIKYVYRDFVADIREVRGKDYGNCEGPIPYNQHNYYFCQVPLEWDQARAACEWKKDRYLVHVDDAEENSFLHERFHDGPFWLGAYISDIAIFYEWLWSDTDRPFFKGVHYQCISATDSSIRWEVLPNNYVNWAGCDNFPEDLAQPHIDSGVEESCTQMRTDGYWSNEDCALGKAFVCEEQGWPG